MSMTIHLLLAYWYLCFLVMKSVCVSVGVSAGLLFGVAGAWEYVNELRLAGELRVANEGLAHDDSHWIISNQHFLYSTTTVQPLRIQTVNHHAIPDSLTSKGYNHIGDIDCFEGIIYGGIEGGDSTGYLAKWNATDLSYISATQTELPGVPWVAVDYEKREIYAAKWNDCCEFSIYSIDDFQFLRTLTVKDMPSEIQGSAFYNGDLYVSSNINVSVYKIDVTTGETSFVLSDDYIEKHLYEMEGLTFWDLESEGYGSEGLGTMHLFGNFMEVKEKAIRNFKV